MKIYLVAKEQPLFDAFTRYCKDLPDVEIYLGSILDLKVDAVVSPANSFGFMDGGLDLFYTLRFGPSIQTKLQELIQKQCNGELLVGQVLGLSTHDPSIPYMISAPTMRVPMRLYKYTVNPYLATKAVLTYCKEGNIPFGSYERPYCIKSIAFPGMGTGVGSVPPTICAKQMAQAIKDVYVEPIQFPKTWKEISTYHFELSKED